MSSGNTSDNAGTSRSIGIAGWVVVLAGLGTVIGFGTGSKTGVDVRMAEEDRPFAQTSRDDRGSPVWLLAFSPDGTQLASATISGDVWVRNLLGGDSRLFQRGVLGSAQSLAFSADGKNLLIAGWCSGVRVRDASTGWQLECLQCCDDFEVSRIAFSPDGKYLAMGGRGGALSIWEWDSRRRLADLEGHRGGINALAFSRDGSTLATVDSAGLGKLWDVRDRRERASIQPYGLGSPFSGVAFSSASNMLATASYPTGAVRLWNSTDGGALSSPTNTSSVVRAISFSPDGTMLAMARDDGTATIWGVKQARELGSVHANAKGLLTVAFSRDGRSLATGGTDGCVRLWDVAQALSVGAAR